MAEETSGEKHKATESHDRFGLLHLAQVFDRRLLEIESGPMLHACDRSKLNEVREAIAEHFLTMQMQVIGDIMHLASLPDGKGILQEEYPDPSRLSRLYGEMRAASVAGDTLAFTQRALIFSVSTLMRHLLHALHDLPRKLSDGTFDRSHMAGPINPQQEHPYTIGRVRGSWNRLKRSIPDYLLIREAWLRARGITNLKNPPRVKVDLRDLVQQLRNAYWGDNLMCVPIALALLRIGVIHKLDLARTYSVEQIASIETSELVQSLIVAGFHPFEDMSAFMDLILACSIASRAGFISEAIDEQALVTLTDFYLTSLDQASIATEDLARATATLAARE